jgi:UDP-GlcNAc:undecaprenyl-phosphate/decaprenyl-phosphate GlcNAc-1-phosphate transferase
VLNKVVELVVFCLVGFMLSMVCNEILLRFSKSLGIRNNNDVLIRWSNESKPSLGGVSFFIVFICISIVYSIVFFEKNIFHDLHFVGLMLAGSIAFLMGLADDAYNTKPLAKLAIQIICGLVFVNTGTTLVLFHNDFLDATVTVIWVVGIMNSLNMLDNMDGITGTTVFFILLSCLFSGWILFGFSTDIWTISLIAMIGAIAGFLIYNVHPSKLFMGDAGSQFIGLYVAFFAIKNLWNVGADTGHSSWLGIVITLIAFTPAAADTFAVVINRLRNGSSPMIGGKDHTTHHLVYSGLSEKKVWYVFIGVGLVSSFLAILMVDFLKHDFLFPLVLSCAYFLMVFGYLFRVTLKHKAPVKNP